MTTFGTLLRQFRVGAALSQEALAERCRISPGTIAALERGRRQAPRLSTVSLIADALQLPPSDRALLAGAARGTGPPVTAERVAEAGEIAAAGQRATGRPGQRDKDRLRGRMPVPLTPLFGRHAESGRVAQALASERLVTLVGPGGVGKTRLALLVANQSLDKFAGGTWWVELGSLDDGEGVPEALLRSLGAGEQPNVSVREQVLAALPDDPVLFVFDNCEHVLDAVANLVAELLAHLPLTVLATSREPLGVPGEVRWPVPALAVPARGATIDAEQLAEVHSIQLFVERATRAYPGFGLTDANAEAAARICRRLEGIPLAIELAAARAHAQSLSQLADELEERVPLTASAARGVPARHSTLLACVDWSYRLLDDQESAAFRCLAGFPGSFSADAFLAVASRTASPGPYPSATVLSRLVEKSLVSADPQAGRYRALETIRVFAADRADEQSELEAIHDAHAGWFSAWLSTLGAANATDDVLDQVETEYANIRAALGWSIEGRSSRAAAMVADLGVAWHQQNRFHDARVLGDGALEVAAEVDQPGWARAVGALGQARVLSGDAAFRSAISEAEKIAREAHDLLAEGQCCLTQGYGAPFDADRLAAAYELGATSCSPLLAGVAAVALASGGTDDQRETWLGRAGAMVEGLENSTLRANYELARADSLMERGEMQEALDLATEAALDRRVMPTTRLLGIGLALQVAVNRTDLGGEELVERMTDELAQVWPVGGSWLTSSWTAYGALLQLWLALLRGEDAPVLRPEDLRRLTRLAVTPSVVRSVCRAMIQAGGRPEASEYANGASPPTPGSLMATSIAAVEAAIAVIEGDDEEAGRCWAKVLELAAANEWRLLACDALEALGCLASRRKDIARAERLLAAADQRRQDLAYRFRSGFEQEQVDQAWATIGAPRTKQAVLAWPAAVEAALSA